MNVLIVVESPKHWDLDIPGSQVISAQDYLTSDVFKKQKRARVFNLCRSRGYQTSGYYVSLLATARGHKPLPSVKTVQALRQSQLVRIASEELEQLTEQLLAPIKASEFELSVYFGRNLARRYDRLCHILFELFPAPLLRAEFVRDGHWRLRRLKLLASAEIPVTHRPFVIEQAQRFFARPRYEQPKNTRYDLAVLVEPGAEECPSDERALSKLLRAAKRQNIGAWLIDKRDYGRLSEFDALFIRTTTAVDHYTYRFASRAAAEGQVVIDDPESILRCSNKVYQAELFEANGIACPKTLIVHANNTDQVGKQLGFPCVLKRPDSAFSVGVVRVHNEEELATQLTRFFASSELVVAQEFVESSFDWRVGVLGNKPLFVCKYYMAKGHWQIQNAVGGRGRRFGKVDTFAIEDAPAGAVDVALRTAALIGDSLYGVDVKETPDGRFLIMEINDNPNIESGNEDAVLKDRLYDMIVQHFCDRLESRGQRRGAP